MGLSIADCKWPDLPEKCLSALKNSLEYVLTTYPSVVGVIASGTIVRGTPDQSSDLDIYVIHTDKYRQRVQKFFSGVPAEIFVNPPSMIEQYLKEEALARRLITAHMLATGFVIIQSDPIVDTLRSKGQVQLATQPESSGDLTVPRYMIASLFEDAIDCRKRDRSTSRMILSQAVEQMMRHAFVKCGKYLPRQKDLLSEVAKLNRELGTFCNRFFRTNCFRTQVKTAAAIADHVLGVRGFFEWKSNPEQVA